LLSENLYYAAINLVAVWFFTLFLGCTGEQNLFKYRSQSFDSIVKRCCWFLSMWPIFCGDTSKQI